MHAAACHTASAHTIVSCRTRFASPAHSSSLQARSGNGVRMPWLQESEARLRSHDDTDSIALGSQVSISPQTPERASLSGNIADAVGHQSPDKVHKDDWDAEDQLADDDPFADYERVESRKQKRARAKGQKKK